MATLGFKVYNLKVKEKFHICRIQQAYHISLKFKLVC